MIDHNLRRRLSALRTRSTRRSPLSVARAAGRAPIAFEQIEQRVMLAGDHPSLPGTWGPFPPGPAADLITLDSASGVGTPARGRATGYTNQSSVFVPGPVTGTIAAGDTGDLFKFVMPSTAGRTRDFVSVLADTTAAASTLDTFVEIYDKNGTLLVSGANNSNSFAGTVSTGLNALLPVASRAPDGWAGFEGTAGETYFIRVRPDPNPVAGRTTTGNYTLTIDAATIEQTVDQNPDVVIMGVTVPNVDFGRAFAENELTATQEDIVYRITTPDDARFNSLTTFQAVADVNTLLNPHLDVYTTGNSSGIVSRIIGDTDAGRQTDSFTTAVTAKATTYYIRVRSDDLRPAPTGQPVGVYQLVARFAANNIAIDAETRLGLTGRAITAHDNPTTPWSNIPLRTSSSLMAPRLGTDSQVFKFTSQGTGLGIITVVAQTAFRPLADFVPRLPQPAMRLFDANGGFIDFNKGDGSAQLLTSVVGGRTYYVVVEGFDNAVDGAFQIFIESHHTNDATQPVDDHIDTPLDANGNPISSIPAWQLASPIRFGDAFQDVDLDGNPVRDRGWLQTGTGRGRIQGQGDLDLFQFVAPVNQLSDYEGEDSDNSLPLYVGGNFNQSGTDPRTGQPYTSDNVAIFDGGTRLDGLSPQSWFNAGPANEADGAIDGPIFALTIWDADGGGANLPILVAGGNFATVNGAPAGNLAFRVFDGDNGRYVWSANPFNTTGDNPITTNGPVLSLGSGDVIPDTHPFQLTLTAPELYIGGSFTDFTGLACNNIFNLFLTAGGGLAGTDLNGGVTGPGVAVNSITMWDPPAQGTFPAKPVNSAGMPADTVTVVPPTLPDLPLQVYFGGSFANAFATNPPLIAANRGAAPGPITGINNLAHWGVRNIMGDPLPTLQGNGLPNGFVITFGNSAAMPAGVGTATPAGYGVNGPVNALTVWDDPGQLDVNGMLEDIPERLVIGGAFTSSGTTPAGGPAPVAANNIIAYDYTKAGNAQINAAPNPAPQVDPVLAAPRYQAVGVLPTGPVRALAIWHADTASGTMIDNVTEETLVAAGDLAAPPGGFLATLNSSGTITTGWTPLVFGIDGTIRTIAVFENDAIGAAPGHVGNVSSDFETIYIGGDFTQLIQPGAAAPVPANHISRMEVQYTPARVESWSSMLGGTQGVSPGEAPGAVSGVFALLPFQDNVEGVWDRNERRATRVQIVASATADSRVGGNFLIRVFDSNFNLVYQNNQLDPSNQDPVTAGSNDPSRIPVFPTPPNPYWVQTEEFALGFKVWAGEVYYVEVSDAGGGTGRYTVSVTTDAVPPRPDPVTQDTLGFFPDGISVATTPVGKGEFEDAPEISLGGDGKGSPFLNPLANLATPPSAYSTRTFFMTPDGVGRQEFYDGPTISRVSDTHIYQFRAPNDGTAEIRLSTIGIVRGYQEGLIDQDGNVTSQAVMNPAPLDGVNAKRINSPFHGAIRVYNNDRVQEGYSDGNQGVAGFADAFQTYQQDANSNPQEDGVRVFSHTDPRLVINVRKGNVYFIEIESAFKGTFELNPDLVDWRHATGAYDLVVSASQAIIGGSTVDDFWPDFDTFGQPPVNGIDGTVIPINRQTGAGTISGNIHNTPTGPFANPSDADAFTVISEGRGFFQVRVTPSTPTLSPRVRVYDDTATLVTTASGGIGGVANLQFAVTQGQRYFIVVDGSGTEGNYVVDVTSPVQLDDHPFSNALPNDLANPTSFWANSKALQLNRFLGLYGDQTNGAGAIGALNGSVENPDDRDLFKFTAEQYEIATVNVTAVDPTLNPLVIVYEITRDGSEGGTPVNGAGLNVFLIIGLNDDLSANSTNSQVSFSVTPGRDYYVLVMGSNLNTDFGRYQLAVNVAPTDDHPNNPLAAAPTNTPLPGEANDFPNGSIVPVVFDPVNFTSTGSVDGELERAGDTDLFRFTAQASGTANITLARALSSTLALDAVVLNASNQPIGGVTFSGSASSITSTDFNVVQGQQYYIVVRANGTVVLPDTETGAYSLTVNTDPVDDYLPTPGTSTPSNTDFTGATNIALSTTNGIGTINGALVPTGDSDIFKFSTIQAGAVTVRISTPLSVLNPRVVIFNSSQVQVFAANGNGDSASVTFNATAGAQQYFVLVLADPGAMGINGVGGYTVTVSASIGGGGGGGGPDDYPNAGEWNDAANIGLDTRTGFGSVTGNISPAGDTDLFRFTVPGNGFIDLQLNTPTGGLVDGQLRVFNAARTQIHFDAAGILGSTAAIKFNAIAGEQYFVLVEPVGTATGSYTLRLQTQPLTHFLYFPEGFTGSTINEYVPMVNPNSYAIDVAVYARYETGANPNTPIYTGTIPANSRGGITISTRDNPGAALVRPGVGYALEIQSTGPMGATFSHYDFDTAVGESFTNRISTVWTFAEANKDPNNYRDFLLFYNPGNTAANLSVTLYYADGTTSTFSATVDALRRNGVNFDNDSRVTRTGKFGIRIDSDQPIVSSLTSYNLPRGGGDGVLGDADGGNTNGVVTNITSGGGAFSTISFLNTNSQPATVTVTADYGRTDIPKLIRVYTVAPNSQLNKNLAAVGLIPGQTAGITYTSNVPITFQATEYKFGDGDATTTATSVARGYFFGDLFVNPALAGIKYIEQLGLYNPGQVSITITGKYLFNDGSTATTSFQVNPGTFTFVSIDQQPAIIGRSGLAFFSLSLESSSPFIASMTHYDLFLNGGWAALGAPIGLTNPLSSVV